MRQRLALAAALLGDPQVLLLDEPSNGLDPDGIRWLREYLKGFATRGGTVFVSSHLIGELSMFADDLVVVGAGRLLAAETVAAITARNEVAVVVTTPQPDELAALLTAHGVIAEQTAGRIVVRESSTETVSRLAFDNRIRLVEITEESRSLEDSLLDMTREYAEFASA
jgi:ABC-2 type transport system ATP-binding protein